MAPVSIVSIGQVGTGRLRFAFIVVALTLVLADHVGYFVFEHHVVDGSKTHACSHDVVNTGSLAEEGVDNRRAWRYLGCLAQVAEDGEDAVEVLELVVGFAAFALALVLVALYSLGVLVLALALTALFHLQKMKATQLTSM